MDDNKPTHDIFISYSRKNKDAVLLIKDEIERTLGLKCWMDLEGIESGSREFTQDIIDAIDTSTAFLFFLSTSSQESKWALKEIDYAINGNKRVVLVRFNADPMTKKFRFEFGRTDVIDWRASDQKGKLLRDLRRWSGNGERSPISSSGAASTLVICPVCGKKNDPKDTFKCRKCGKDDLCLRHQDQETFLCAECAAAQRRVHVGAKSKLCCSEIPFIKNDKKGMRHVRKDKNSDVVQSPVPCEKSEQQSSKRKTTIIGAAGCMSECATYIQQKNKKTKAINAKLAVKHWNEYKFIEAFSFANKADANDPVMMRIMGYGYLYGSGTEVDEEKGRALLETAMNMGDAEAKAEIGSLYKDGIAGYPQDYDYAAKCFKEAAEGGSGKNPLL